MSSTASLRAQRLSFAFDGRLPLFEDLHFQLDPGWTGLVGENGAGKTTLLRLICGELKPTSGQVRILPDGARIHVCGQSVEHLPPEVRALADEPGPQGWTWMGRLELEPSSLDRWSTLSPGERKRWQLAAALTSEPEVLLVDEPTNHLDAPARDRVLRTLARFPGVGIVVSHDREVLAELTHRTLRVAHGEVRLWPGTYALAREAWLLEEENARAQRASAKAELQRQEERLQQRRREREAASAMRSAAARMRNKHDSDARSLGADFRVSTAEKKLGREVEVTRRERDRAQSRLEGLSAHVTREVGRDIHVDHERAAKPRLLTLECESLRRGDRVLLRDVSVTVNREARLWLTGPNGSGKSTLLQALLEKSALPPEKVLHLPQELDSETTARILSETKSLPSEERGRVLGLVAALGLEPERLLATQAPSPGEARKLLLAWGLGRGVWLLILDEPTNHLDLPSIERLESALKAYPGALVLTSHDARFAKACANIEWRIDPDSCMLHEYGLTDGGGC